jgi:uncharacterized membrane protein
MTAIAIRLVAGCSFVLLGRWAYRNPQKVYPAVFYTNPDSRMLVGLTRLFASMLMIVGCFSVIGLVMEKVSSGMLSLWVTVCLSFGLAWFLRPKVENVSKSVPTARGVPRLTPRAKWFLGIMLSTAAVFTLVVLIFVLRHR